MHVVINEKGRVVEGSATLIIEVGTATVPPGGAIPSTVDHRTFQCGECTHQIDARARELTIHDCDRRGNNASAGFPLRLVVECGGRKPLRATIKGEGLADERVLGLLEEQGYRRLGGRTPQFAHFTIASAVEKLQSDLEDLGMNVLYEEHRKV